MTTRHHDRRSERGFSLAEILTATAIFAVIFIAALMVYDRSNRVYKQGVEASDVQQSTRVAFDKLVAEMRMVGFDYDRDGSPLSSLASPWRPNTPYSIGNLVQPDPPNGHTYMCIVAGTSAPAAFTEWDTTDGSMTVEPAPSTVRWQEVGSVTYQQPDEQLEFAGPSALVIRANFDYDWETGTCDPANLDAPCQNGRERRLESAAFPVVTTDNDEIVGYALKPTNGAGPDTLTFYADLTRPRSVHPGTGDEEPPVEIPNVDLCSAGCNNPPYTLYRFTFDADGNVIETPIADNIRELKLRYFTDAAATAANEIATADLPDGQGPYNGAEPDADVPERTMRGDIRSVRIELVGMNPQLDPAYNDPTDTYASKYRKYRLETLIVPRNIGRHGMREFASTAPGQPTLRTVCAGSCNAVYLVWTPPLTGGDVETYNILYSPIDPAEADPCSTAGYVYAEDAGRNLDGYAGLFITPGQRYKFAVQSVNKYGSYTSGCSWVMVENTTRPLAPIDLDATNDVDPANPAVANQINLKWPRVNQNDPAKRTTSCDDGTSRAQASMPSVERRHFILWKSKDEMFTPGDAGSEIVLDSTTLPQPMTLDEYVSWADKETANCTPYWYRIQTIDGCYTNPTWNENGDASIGASTGFYPPVGSAAARGQAFEDQTPPAAPVSFDLVSDSCASGFCDFVLRWAAVTKDDGAAPDAPPIYIDNYTIRVEQKASADPLDNSYVAVTSQNITDGILEARFEDLPAPTLEQPYRFIVRARDCIDGVDSVPVRYPCLFGNDPTASVAITAPVNYGGDGLTSANPWVINDPAVLRISSSVTMSRVSAGFFQNGQSVGSVTYEPGTPFTTFDLTIPGTAPDSTVTEALIVVTDTTGCKVDFSRYVIDPAAPGCALIDKNETPQPSPQVETWNDRNVTYALHNDSNVAITVEKVVINWTRGTKSGDADALLSVTFPNGTNTLPVPCTTGRTVIGPVDASRTPTPFTISAFSRQDITVTFRGATGRALQQNPVNRICVVYRVPTGDRLSCSLITSGGTCDGNIDGAECQ